MYIDEQTILDACMIRRSVVEPLPFLGTQKAKRAGLTRLNLNFENSVLWISNFISNILTKM